MPIDTLFVDVFSIPHLPVLLGGIVLLLIVLLAFSQRKHWQTNQSNHTTLKMRVDILREEMNELIVDQFDGSSREGSRPEGGLAAEQHAAEKSAYEILWPLVWSLHDKLGSFLRAVEAGDAAGESRVAARHAALDARAALNRTRPFCHQHVDALATQLIDTDIKAHLAGCQFQDLLKDTAGADNQGEDEQLRQRFRMLYDVESRELLNQLVDTIRRRMVRHPPD